MKLLLLFKLKIKEKVASTIELNSNVCLNLYTFILAQIGNIHNFGLILPQNWVDVPLRLSIFQNCGKNTTISQQLWTNWGYIGVVVMVGGCFSYTALVDVVVGVVKTLF